MGCILSCGRKAAQNALPHTWMRMKEEYFLESPHLLHYISFLGLFMGERCKPISGGSCVGILPTVYSVYGRIQSLISCEPSEMFEY